MKYFCCDELRRQKLKESQTLNGIDFLEVVDDLTLPPDRRQRTLLVSFFFDKGLSTLDHTNIKIEGGTRIRTVGVEEVHVGNAIPAPFLTSGEAGFLPASPDELSRLLVVRTDSNGDFSRYTLRVVSGTADLESDQATPAGFDPILSAIEFFFKAGCPSEFDCLPRLVCPTAPPARPDINYLAKDYASFRRLMLDRMALLVPSWQERSPADLGVTLIEWLAAIGDQLSYHQDAVATEAYLGTARRRTSVRRHARLVDYRMHDGCNARAWVHVDVDGPPVTLEKGTRFLTADPSEKPCIPVADFSATRALDQGRVIFEAMHDLVASEAHSRMLFYTWGDSRCCLPAGATKATLLGHLPDLKAGDILILTEVMGPKTGRGADADPARRHPVRLTYVLCHVPEDPDQPLKDPLFDTEITEIEWAAADALPFPFCISAVSDSEHGSKPLENVSVVLGNIILADHGVTVEESPIRDGKRDTVPEARPIIKPNSEDRCQPAPPEWKYPKFRPGLSRKPLTMAVAYPETLLFTFTPADAAQFAADLTSKASPGEFEQQLTRRGISFRPGRVTVQGSQTEWSVSDGKNACLIRGKNGSFDILTPPSSASEIALTPVKSALPTVELEESNRPGSPTWHPVSDLLDCTEDDRYFTVETQEDATGFIRFGDDVYGVRPDAGTMFRARYRVGNGTSGNIGAGSLAQVVTDESVTLRVTNPLPARGGIDPESMEQVRQKAPFAFRVQERAVTAEDYAQAARKYPGVQNAVASFRWTGSWHTVFLTIDRKGGLPVDDDFRAKMLEHIERYRLAGYDLVLDPPRYVSLEIDMRVCVEPGYFREDVKGALLEVFSNGRLSDGRPALFHPDQFTFGQPVYLSRIYEAAASVDGVRSVHVTRFQRQGQDESDAREEGYLMLSRLEIARLDNDPNYPDHGVLRIEMGGGQ